MDDYAGLFGAPATCAPVPFYADEVFHDNVRNSYSAFDAELTADTVPDYATCDDDCGPVYPECSGWLPDDLDSGFCRFGNGRYPDPWGTASNAREWAAHYAPRTPICDTDPEG